MSQLGKGESQRREGFLEALTSRLTEELAGTRTFSFA